MNPDVLRIVDANANRAREALRVIEDYARFVLDDADLCQSLKLLRHEFSTVAAPFISDAILHRDTPGDVGTSIKTDTELTRTGATEVVIASGKRFGEALRVLEEFIKTARPLDAAKVESIRYRFYDIEQRITIRLASDDRRFHDVHLYVLITESICRKPWLQVAQDAIAGGADALQLREKDLEDAELLRRARELTELCRANDVVCIINDRPDIAQSARADGVHVGQNDLPVPEVRKLLGRGKIIGVSTHRVEQAKQAIADGADYVGVGPVFRSPTKPRDFLPGLEYASHVAQTLQERIPAVAIAGITERNVDEVLATGIRAIAVTSAVIACDDVRGAAARLKAKLTRT